MQKSPKGIWKVISASSVGTLIEWYDFYIFGSLATIISKQFFPPDKSSAALLSTLAIFAAGFIVRPFGALVFGRLGDLIGRKYTFLLTLVLMGASTFLIGLIPNYASIGIAAPILVLVSALNSRFSSGWRIRRSGYLCCRTRARRSPWFFYQLDSNYRHPWFVFIAGRYSIYAKCPWC
jgi:MFS family permease